MMNDVPDNSRSPMPSRSSRELAEELYETLKRLAAAQLKGEATGVTLQPTMLVHEAYLRLCAGTDDMQWDTAGHFFVSAARAMRRILIDRARARDAEKRGGATARREVLELDQLLAGQRTTELIALDDALAELAEVYPRKAVIVELKFFGKMAMDEIAAALGVSTAMVKRDWQFARAWLQKRMQSET